MHDAVMQILLQNLIHTGPLLLVCLLGLVVCIAWLGRSRRAAGLAAGGLGLLLLATILSPVLTVAMFQARETMGGSQQILSLMLGLMMGLMRALGLLLLVLGVFAGRESAHAGGQLPPHGFGSMGAGGNPMHQPSDSNPYKPMA